MQDATNLNRLAYFVAVVDTGSFTRAAEHLGITKAVVSQQVAKLEQELGTTLLVRTTRRLQPTEEGLMFHGRCVSILRDADDAIAQLAQGIREPRGLLRITAPYDYGTSVLVPVVTAFGRRNPDCRVELLLGDEMIDLVANGVDLAVRVGWLEDSGLSARKIASFRQILVGPRSLYTERVQFTRPEQLSALPFVANNALKYPLDWVFTRGDGERASVRFSAHIAINTTPAVLEAVTHSGGLSVLPDFLVGSQISNGTLVEVLPEWELPSGGVYTVYPAARFRPRKVSAFVEMLVAALRQVAR